MKYTEALDLCPLKCAVERSVIYANRAACHIKLVSRLHFYEGSHFALVLSKLIVVYLS